MENQNTKDKILIVKLSGQLWEECHFCGKEPIYISHGCCEKCAKDRAEFCKGGTYFVGYL